MTAGREDDARELTARLFVTSSWHQLRATAFKRTLAWPSSPRIGEFTISAYRRLPWRPETSSPVTAKAWRTARMTSLCAAIQTFRGRRPTYVGYGLRPHRLDRLKVQGGNLGSTNAASA
jgi:hypothetical protein